MRAGLTDSSGRAGRQLTPFHLLTALPCSVGGAVTDEIVPHGVTHSPVETGVDLMKRKQPELVKPKLLSVLYNALGHY